MVKRTQSSNKRNTLQTLQPCATVGCSDLVSKNGVVPAKHGEKSSKKTKATVDPSQTTLVLKNKELNITPRGSTKASSETENDLKQSTSDEAYQLMGQTNIPETYWKDYSEQQCEALSETLKENKKLHEENEQLKAEISKLTTENSLLKDENEMLSELASRAEELTNIVQSVIEEKEKSEDGVENFSQSNETEADTATSDEA
ncbi:geminin-like [Argonauta hians]